MKEYLAVVKNPMDLGTVLQNCYRGVYQSSDQLIEHLKLVFENAIAFNAEIFQMQANDFIY